MARWVVVALRASVQLPAAAAELQRHGVPTDLELPEGEPSPTGPIVLDPDAQQAPVG